MTHYLKSNLESLDAMFVSLDTNRISRSSFVERFLAIRHTNSNITALRTQVFFTISSLDLIGQLDKVVPDKKKLYRLDLQHASLN